MRIPAFILGASLAISASVACSNASSVDASPAPDDAPAADDDDAGAVAPPEDGGVHRDAGRDSGSKSGLTVQTARAVVTVHRGATVALPVSVARTGFDGDVALEVTGLPSGVTIANVTVAAGETDAAMSVQATSGAPIGTTALTLRARAVANGVTATAPLSLVVSDGARLDSSFGTGGLARFFVSLSAARPANAHAVASDGSIVVVGGYAPSPANDHTAIAYRITSAGSLDTTFGQAGESALSSLGPATQVLLQPDGKIVYCAARSSDHRLSLVRLTPLGAVDTSFGTQGVVTVPAGGPTYCAGLAMDGTGRFLATGSTSASSTPGQVTAWISRFTSSGALDPSFGTGGLASTKLGGVSASFSKLIVAPPAIFAIGTRVASTGANLHGVVVKLDMQGNVDASFGTGGFHEHTYGVFDVALAGGGATLYGDQLHWYKLASNGALDTTWGQNGVLESQSIDWQYPYSAATTDAAGVFYRVRYGGGIAPGQLWSYTAGGMVDATFGGAGNLAMPSGMTAISPKLLVGADGRLVILDSSNAQFWLTRFVL